MSQRRDDTELPSLLSALTIELGVILNVLNPVEHILEPDGGENVTVTECFSAQVDQQLNRAAQFKVDISNSSSAVLGSDYSSGSQYIVIPANFSGYFMTCLNTTVLGNDRFDGLRRVVYNITALSIFDDVSDPLPVINILEDDGKLFA